MVGVVGWIVNNYLIILGVVFVFVVILVVKRKKKLSKHESVQKEIYEAREKIRVLDKLLRDLELYFKQVEEKLDMSKILNK